MSREIQPGDKVLVDSKTFYDIVSIQGDTITTVVPTTNKEIKINLREAKDLKFFSGEPCRLGAYLIDTSFYEKIKDIDWDMAEVDRSFDPEKVKAYLALLDEPHRGFVKEVIEKTLYVPYKEFKKALFQTFYLFQNKIKNEGFYILMDDQKIGSEHWLLALLWPELSKMNVLGIITPGEHKLEGKIKHILMIDDAIYTGLHIGVSMDDLINAVYPHEADLVFHLVIPYIGKPGKRFIEERYDDLGINYHLYNYQVMNTLRSLIDINKYYPDEPLISTHQFIAGLYGVRKGALQKLYELRTSDPFLIYFDHKVAADSCTIPTVYLEGIIPGKEQRFGTLLKQPPSRYKIEELGILYCYRDTF